MLYETSKEQWSKPSTSTTVKNKLVSLSQSYVSNVQKLNEKLTAAGLIKGNIFSEKTRLEALEGAIEQISNITLHASSKEQFKLSA